MGNRLSMGPTMTMCPAYSMVKRTYTSTASKVEAERIERMAGQARATVPAWVMKILNEKGVPALDAIRKLCEEYGPRFNELLRKALDVYRRLPQLQAQALWGLMLCFFGGRYAVSIAAFEAFRFTGGSMAYMHIQDLAEQVNAVQEANAADDEVDSDDDRIADIRRCDSKQLVARKVDIVLRVMDPEIVVRAIGGLWTAYLGVLTTLKLQFAHRIALAQSLGEHLRPTMAKVVGPTVVAVTPPEYHKWISPGIDLMCKAIATVLAWRIQRLISTVQSGFSGGMLVSTALLALLRERAILTAKDDETCFDEIVGWSIGACGIYVQLFKGGVVPRLLSPVLWPLDIAEWILKWQVTWTSAPPKWDASSK